MKERLNIKRLSPWTARYYQTAKAGPEWSGGGLVPSNMEKLMEEIVSVGGRERETAIYMKNVRQARNLGWKGFCSQAKNPYGKHYKAAFRNSVTPAQLILLKEKEATGGQLQIAAGILEEIFPHPVSTPNQATSVNYSPDDCPFSPQEVARTINGLPKGKAPGLDGIDNIVIQQINQKFPQLFTDFFNKCLTLKKFPDSLKIGNIILFP
ncbi:hypothetical protein HNY73_018832 [Argiope bruennichi]|uniref:Reverse transcriptase n=1 Tax=Argiope bruennichi TaxID=94029 RepID=A0A8T0EFB8_ARGBR|nr:hypothetical protein HNY73_018832 [Argiope bruennichi]